MLENPSKFLSIFRNLLNIESFFFDRKKEFRIQLMKNNNFI